MSIASAIATKQQQVADAYTAVSNKGGTLPATQNLTNLATCIDSIDTSQGGSDTFEAQLLMENIVNSGTLETEPTVVSDVVSALTTILGE